MREEDNTGSKSIIPSSSVCVEPFWQPWHCWQVWAQNCLWSLAAHPRLGCQWLQPLSVLNPDAEAAPLYAVSDASGVSLWSQRSFGLSVQLEAVIKNCITMLIYRHSVISFTNLWSFHLMWLCVKLLILVDKWWQSFKVPHYVQRTRSSSSHSTSRPSGWWRRRRRSSSQSCCPHLPPLPTQTKDDTTSHLSFCAPYMPDPYRQDTMILTVRKHLYSELPHTHTHTQRVSTFNTPKKEMWRNQY